VLGSLLILCRWISLRRPGDINISFMIYVIGWGVGAVLIWKTTSFRTDFPESTMLKFGVISGRECQIS
jgi:hypothetical protein